MMSVFRTRALFRKLGHNEDALYLVFKHQCGCIIDKEYQGNVIKVELAARKMPAMGYGGGRGRGMIFL